MSRPARPMPLDDEVIDVEPPRRRRWLIWLIVAAVIMVFILLLSISIYVESLWFDSLGYATVYWYTFRLKLLLFVIFLLLTLAILRAAFWVLERVFAASVMERRTVILNNQPVSFSLARFVRPAAWLVSTVIAFITGLSMSDEWETFALYLNQQATTLSDPIFQKPLGFYLFTLPVYRTISSWLLFLSFAILCGAVVFTLLSIPQKLKKANAPVGV
ncbi:MAG: UPF0182 family protein, partial [Acidobacteria bacterium]|nr:UPF0182 family protein [Acidobacteriota bacterium]